MGTLMKLVATYGLALVFANVLAEQLGLPLADELPVQIAGGRRQGHRILKTLCRVSLSPDTCVSQTERHFEKWGLSSLLVAKFVPGFSTVAPPLAGATRAPFGSFLLFDAGGAVLWAGSALVVGMAFHHAIDRALEVLASFGSWALVTLGAALALFIAFKWWRRRRFFLALRAARISVGDLHHLMDAGKSPLVLDVRSGPARLADPRRVPGAEVFDVTEIDQRMANLPRDREIILYCT